MNENSPLTQRLATLLARIVDEPLLVMPGTTAFDTRPFELRLAHMRPDLSESAAELLEDAGQ